MTWFPAIPRAVGCLAMTAPLLAACNDRQEDVEGDIGAMTGKTSGTAESTGSEQGNAEGQGAGSESAGSEQGNETEPGSGESSGTKFDLESGDDSGGDGGVHSCVVVDDMDAVPECGEKAPSASFDPEIQWSWTQGNVISVPLVANLTDDNGDGKINLCDVPDVVIVRAAGPPPPNGADGQIVVLDGATGTEHFTIAPIVAASMAPAIGDIDHDGLPEIVAAAGGGGGYSGGSGSVPTPLVAFEHDGTAKWTSAHAVKYSFGIALADLDNDEDVEIITNSSVTDHNGVLVWEATVLPCTPPFSIPGACPTASTAADLDGDRDLEIVAGNAAYHHDGTVYFQSDAITAQAGLWVWPQVADLDSDPEPEVLLVSAWGQAAILEHDGATKLPMQFASPIWYTPAHVHDFDGDGEAEFGFGTGDSYQVYRQEGTLAWSQPLIWQHMDSAPGGTAFDFLGAGAAQAVYNDQAELFVYDGSSGVVLLKVANATQTTLGYPVVADVDDDRSAEILVSSSNTVNAGVHAIRDKGDRWIQARRIWNQHTYHVTNVREDGTIPQFETPHWTTLNTFRTNAQIEGGICTPPPAE